MNQCGILRLTHITSEIILQLLKTIKEQIQTVLSAFGSEMITDVGSPSEVSRQSIEQIECGEKEYNRENQGHKLYEANSENLPQLDVAKSLISKLP